MKKIILPLLAVLSLSQATATSIPAFLYVPVWFNDSTEIGNTGIYLKFDGILEETRCPVDVQCIRQGNASIALTATKGGQTEKFVLNTTNQPQKKVLWGYSFSINKLQPYPGTEAPVWLDSLVQVFLKSPNSDTLTRVYKCYPGSAQRCTDFMNTKKAPYYYVRPGCCDQFTTLYDSTGKVICHPDGGITGNGDGKCSARFVKDMTRCILWQYPGRRPNMPRADIRYDKVKAGPKDIQAKKASYSPSPNISVIHNGQNSTVFAFSLNGSGNTSLGLYDIMGKHVITVLKGYRKAGNHVVTWNGKGIHGNLIPSGIYLVRLTTSGIVTSRKMGIFSARH